MKVLHFGERREKTEDVLKEQETIYLNTPEIFLERSIAVKWYESKTLEWMTMELLLEIVLIEFNYLLRCFEHIYSEDQVMEHPSIG